MESLSLGEGNTPWVKSRHIGPEMGVENLYFKLESANPSGSYKDRFATLAIANILQKRGKAVIATSSGNTGAALAAYAAAAGLPCKIAIVDGAPEGKLNQMRAYGAKLFMIKGFGLNPDITEAVFQKLAGLSHNFQTEVQVSAYKYSPIGMMGVQTIAFETAETFSALDHVFVPAGGGGLNLAIVRGFEIWKGIHPSFEIPRIHCVQPEGNDTIAGNLRKGLDYAQAVEKSTTSISGLQVANVIDGHETLLASKRTRGNGFLVSDSHVTECQKLLAQKEGIFTEPAGAVALAGWLKAVQNREINVGDKSVCIISGSGFKDPQSTEMMIGQNPLFYLDSHLDMERYFMD